MKTRNQCFPLLVTVAGVVLVAALAPPSVRGQTTTPRTPWGEPDLQGIWNNPYVVPLERPRQFGTREFLTKEEVAAEERRLRELAKGPGRDARDGTGTEKDVARAYNEHWFGDPSLLRSTRTSMIIDPPDGRMPPLTPEAIKRPRCCKEPPAAGLDRYRRGETSRLRTTTWIE